MNMRLLLMCFLLMVTGLANAQDSTCWKLILNHKLLKSSTLLKQQPITLTRKEKGDLKLIFNCDKHPDEMNRSFLIMDKNRKELFRLSSDYNNDFVLISINKLRALNRNQPVDIYTVAIPKDSLMARTWRVKPLLLTTISWQQ